MLKGFSCTQGVVMVLKALSRCMQRNNVVVLELWCLSLGKLCALTQPRTLSLSVICCWVWYKTSELAHHMQHKKSYSAIVLYHFKISRMNIRLWKISRYLRSPFGSGLTLGLWTAATAVGRWGGWPSWVAPTVNLTCPYGLRCFPVLSLKSV